MKKNNEILLRKSFIFIKSWNFRCCPLKEVIHSEKMFYKINRPIQLKIVISIKDLRWRLDASTKNIVLTNWHKSFWCDISLSVLLLFVLCPIKVQCHLYGNFEEKGSALFDLSVDYDLFYVNYFIFILKELNFENDPKICSSI